MGCGAEDTLVELENVMKAYKRLQDRDPDNKLLKMASIHDDNGGMTFSLEVKRKFWPEGARRIHFYWEYIKALDWESTVHGSVPGV